MWLFSVASAALFSLPVFVTFGAYFGFDHERILDCGFYCTDRDESSSNSTSGSGISDANDANITGTSYCEKSYAITPAPGRYMFNTNQWGDKDNQGDLCLNFTSSALDEPEDYAPGFAVTWHYSEGSASQPVHAFPNANLQMPKVLPVQLSGMTGLTLDVSWTYAPGDSTSSSTNVTALDAANVNANVCIDAFLASDKANASSTTDATYEVMVWLARFGAATDPLGYANGSQATRTVNGTDFDLYYEDNATGQRTFTWLASQNTTSFTGDVGPLFQNLANLTGPSSDDYLGYVAFGTETLYSDTNVTFYVPELEMNVLV